MPVSPRARSSPWAVMFILIGIWTRIWAAPVSSSSSSSKRGESVDSPNSNSTSRRMATPSGAPGTLNLLGAVDTYSSTAANVSLLARQHVTPDERTALLGARTLHVKALSIDGHFGLCAALRQRRDTRDPTSISVGVFTKATCGSSSLGNRLSVVFQIRAVASLSGLPLSFGRGCTGNPKRRNTLQAFLPLLAHPPPGATVNMAQAMAACKTCDSNLAHVCNKGWPEAPEVVRSDLRLAVSRWAQQNSAVLKRNPIDDVAIHLRCGESCARVCATPVHMFPHVELLSRVFQSPPRADVVGRGMFHDLRFRGTS